MYRRDPTDTYPLDRVIMPSVIHHAKGGPPFKIMSRALIFVSCSNLIFPGPFVTVGIHATSRRNQSLALGGVDADPDFRRSAGRNGYMLIVNVDRQYV